MIRHLALTLELLLKKGAHVNARDSDNVTPLHLAVDNGSEEIVKLLLKHGAYVNSACNFTSWDCCMPLWLGVIETSTSWGVYTPLLLAFGKGHEEVVNLLLEYGANVNAQDKDGKTVLHFDVEIGKDKISQQLLESGGNVNAEDNYCKTVLHFAVEKEQDKLGQILLECGANVDAEHMYGKTVQNIAVEKGCSLINLL